MSEALRKVMQYLKSDDKYWSLFPDWSPRTGKGEIGPYPLDFRDRLAQGHYTLFDDDGLPLLPGSSSEDVYLVTRMCGFALAWHQRGVASQDGEAAQTMLLRVADKLSMFIQSDPDGGGLVRSRYRQGGIYGDPSCMNQGEAISVLLRAYQLTTDERYLQDAEHSLEPFARTIDELGVLCTIERLGISWYEEYATYPVYHVLNGMMYSLIGLWELAVSTEHARARQLFDDGVRMLEAGLGAFDRGYWSSYWVPEASNNTYIASMMYHNLHICQLQIMHRITGKSCFHQMSERFAAQAESGVSRARAAATMVLHKLQGRANH